MKKILYSVIITALTIFTIITLTSCKKADYSGTVLKIGSSQNLSDSLYADGALLFEERYGCRVEFTNDFENCDLFLSSGEDFSNCQPIDEYVNINSRKYTKSIITDSCMADGKVYAIGHALMGNINYCVYDPQKFSRIVLPYDYYRQGDWTWENFIRMCEQLDANVSVDWTKSYINMRYALIPQKGGGSVFDYSTQEQIEWLNFVRTLIFDENIGYKDESAFKVGFLPDILSDSIDMGYRFIPWPTKNGRLSEVFVDEYHFCVPKNAENPELSVTLANSLIKSYVESQLEFFQSVMCPEDYKLFLKQLKKTYSYPARSNYVPWQDMVEDFLRGKTVTEHIFNAENNISDKY